MLSRRQLQVFNFVAAFLRDNSRAPTLQEICNGVGLNQPIEASRYLNILSDKKYLSRVPGMCGSLRIIKHPEGSPAIDDPTRAAYARGVAAGRAQLIDGNAPDGHALRAAYRRGLLEGRKEQPKDIAEAFERGVIFGRKELKEELTYAERNATIGAGAPLPATPRVLPFLRRSD